MKLIIDIPEMAYEAFKEWHKNKVASVEQSLIANGIPYEEKPQGDIISREALKKDFCKDVMGGLNWERIINNAPTVEPKQGKWDEIREPFGWDDILSARCSVCGESYPYPEDTGFNDIVEMFKYCPNCGAKMEAGSRWKEEDE